jgi:hypothetical protein
MVERGVPSGEAIWKSLRRLIDELLRRRAGGHLLNGRVPDLDLHLPLRLSGPEAGPAAFSRALRAAIEPQIDAAIALVAAFRPGHAFCHRCDAATCEHSLPPSSRHVFVGYAPTGAPRWEEFAQFCLQQRHPEVDRLYADPPAFLTLVQDAGTLGADLLEPFQGAGQDLLGQLIAGFFPVRSRTGEGRGVLALTVQVGVARAGPDRHRLGLNVLGRTPAGEELSLLWERQEDLAWRRGVRWAQSALASIEKDAGRGRRRGGIPRAELESRVAGILNGLARRLEQDLRGRSRRTVHASLRHSEGDRPTRKALDDIREVRLNGALLVDDRSGALVVLGDRGRTHFFTPEGRLVSSVRYSREAIERKRGSGLWRTASEEESREFRRLLAPGER